jgi:hypothetical protein
MAANASHGIDIVVPTTFESRNSRASLPLDIPSDQPVRLQIAPLDTVRRLFAIPTATSTAAIANGGFTSIRDIKSAATTFRFGSISLSDRLKQARRTGEGR